MAQDDVAIERTPAWRSTLRWATAYHGVSAACGLLCAFMWAGIARVPNYEIRTDRRAVISERALATLFSVDAWYCIIGFFASLVLGLLAWRWFRRMGWMTTLMGVTGPLVAGLCCLWLGVMLTPGPLEPRLAAASPGDSVPMLFDLTSKAAVLVWPFAAMVPILALSSLLPDPEDAAVGTDPR